MPKAPADHFLTTGEVAVEFGVHEETVRRWEERGYITSQRTPGGHRRFRTSEVAACIARFNETETVSE